MHGSHLKLLVIHTVVVQNIYMHVVHRILKALSAYPGGPLRKDKTVWVNF